MPASPDPRALIAAEGTVSLDRYMALANDRYYATRDPLGTAGDFTTAPEISQMFGELVGLALADLWVRAGRPRAHYVELGPGRGTLAADALRAMRVAGLVPDVHLVETSPVLRARQRERLPDATWHGDVGTLPSDGALLIVANEFFDALPIRQLVRRAGGWRERCVAPGLAFADGERVDGPDAPEGTILELRPAADRIAAGLARRLVGQGGALLAIDYGHDGATTGDTLQAVRGHAFADPLKHPGESDLTAHVDFGALARALAGTRTLGPVEQGQWLAALGLSDRAAALARSAPARAEEIAAAYARLSAPEQMGRLFKVLGAVAPHWPNPAGFG